PVPRCFVLPLSRSRSTGATFPRYLEGAPSWSPTLVSLISPLALVRGEQEVLPSRYLRQRVVSLAFSTFFTSTASPVISSPCCCGGCVPADVHASGKPIASPA